MLKPKCIVNSRLQTSLLNKEIDVNRVLQILMEKKRKLEAKEEFTEVAVLYSFLVKLSEQKKQVFPFLWF